MFAAERWARAFVKSCEGTDADPAYRESERGLAVLKAACHALSRLSGRVSGSAAAAQFNGFLRDALRKSGYDSPERGVEAACALIFLVIQKGFYPYNGRLISEIEDVLAQKRHFMTVVLDCAHKPEENFLSELAEKLKTKTGAAKVAVTVQLMPDLIGGYRLNIGNEREDFSVAGQLKQLDGCLRTRT